MGMHTYSWDIHGGKGEVEEMEDIRFLFAYEKMICSCAHFVKRVTLACSKLRFTLFFGVRRLDAAFVVNRLANSIKQST
jgi:hypothetical protein